MERIINIPMDSNCFIVYSENFKTCMVIDPDSELCEDIFKFMESKQLEPEYIFLMHEHFDHIWGVEKNRERFKCKLVASNLCSLLITNVKKNLSIFYNQKGFECQVADLIMEDLSTSLIWQTYPISLYDTPEHSDARICIQIGNYLQEML
ncbi:MAG: MBL fold metallo-hydrolase [Bacteroidales bacterium]